MLKQRRLTAWLRTKKGEPPAKRGRQPQDTESDAEAMSDSSATLDSTSLSSSSNAPTRSCFDPGMLSLSSGSHISRIRLESYSKLYDIGTIAEFARYLNRQDMFNVFNIFMLCLLILSFCIHTTPSRTLHTLARPVLLALAIKIIITP